MNESFYYHILINGWTNKRWKNNDDDVHKNGNVFNHHPDHDNHKMKLNNNKKII